MKTEEMLTRLKENSVTERRARRLEIALHMSADMNEKKDLEMAVAILYHKHFDLTSEEPHFAEPSVQVSKEGELLLGATVSGGQFFFKIKELNQHLAVFGRSGSGKTNFIYHFLRELYRNRVPFFVTDWKADYCTLDFARLFAGIGDYESRPVHVLSVGRENGPGLSVNPLIPSEGVEPRQWLKLICQVFTHAYMGGPRFEQLLRDAVDHFYEKYGVYDGRRDRFPTLLEVKEHLESQKATGRKEQWLQSILSALSSLCFGGTGKALNVSVQPDLSFLLKENVVLELGDLSEADKVFVTETLLLWIRQHRLSQKVSEGLQSVIVLEEAHHLLRAKEESEESVMDVTLREIRSLGVGVVVVDQMPSLISKVALANNFARLTLNLVLKEDKLKMAGCMGLNPEQQDALGDLPVGSAVVKMQDRYTKPFKIKIPFVPVTKLLRSEVPVSKYARRALLQRKSSDVPEKRSGDRISRFFTPDKQKSVEGKNDKSPELNAELALLKDIAQVPVSSIVDRYDRLKLGSRRGNLVKRYLVREGWIEEQIIHGARNWVKLLKPTELGIEKLALDGVKNPACLRRGSLEHLYWIQTIADHLCVKFPENEVLEEYPLGGGQTADVVVLENDKVVLAVEVETGKSDVAANVRKYESLSVPKVILAFTNKAVLEKSPRYEGVEMMTTSQVVAMKKILHLQTSLD